MHIFISGACRSGKTYFANQLAEALNLPVIAYADKLKRVAAHQNPDLVDEIYADTKTPDTRALLCSLSADLRAQYGNDCFIDTAHDYIRDGGIVSDIRFSNELARAKADFPNCIIIYVGPAKDEYDILKLHDEADLILPAKPVKCQAQMRYILSRLNLIK